MAYEHSIHRGRSDMLGGYLGQIKSLDEATQWALIIVKACEAGLGKEELCLELACSWSTITRWRAGHTAPGPFMRQAVKAKLVEMLERRCRSEAHLAREAQPAREAEYA